MYNYNINLIFLIVSLSLSFYKTSPILFDQKRLDKNAKRIGYGYKTANLMELKNLSSTIELDDGYHVEVPDFVGITSDEINIFFEQNGLNIRERWNDIISSVDLENQIEYLKKDINRSDFIEKSNKLANDIENLEIKKQLNLKNVKDFLEKASGKYSILRTSKTDLSTIHRDTWSLMVRSTGKEDTKDLPNAGGNYSEPNVNPDIDDIVNAIKKVVSSYFKPKSLNQRIDAGDNEIFHSPLTPVLLQRMIGEKLGGIDVTEKNIEEIPVGCVVYTGEVEGQTPGVITIQGAFGHNEGVVNSEVAVDTFYVKDDEINVISQIKKHRIVPMKTGDGFSLELVSNPSILQKRQIFSNKTALKISTVAKKIDDFYGDQMDIELIYEPETKTIFLVQARPLQKINSQVASYVTSLDKIPEDNIFKCSVVSSGGGSLRFIRNNNQLITAQTLEDALNMYLYGEMDKNQVLIILVQGNAEPTSHAAAIFRGAGKAILTCDKIDYIEKLTEHDDIDLLVDVQREIIINISDLTYFKNKKLSELINAGLVKSGWFNHPISERLTISESPFFGPLSKINKKFKEEKYNKLIEIMKQGYSDDAQESLVALLWKLNDELYEGTKTILDEEKIEQKQKIYNVATRLAQKMLVDKIFEMDPHSISRLYPINFLSSILFQTDQTNKYVDVFSRSSIIRHYNEIKKFIKYLLKEKLLSKKEINKIIEEPGILSIMIRGNKDAFTDKLGKRWIKFITDIFFSKEKQLIKDLKNIYEILTNLDIFHIWINTIFATSKKDSPHEKILNNLTGEIKLSENFLNLALMYKEMLDNFSPNKAFNNPEFYRKNYSKFENRISYFLSDEFISLLKKKESILSVEVALLLMTKIVDIWDLSIKTLKSSLEYGQKEKIEKFHEMLNLYFNILEKWSKYYLHVINEKKLQHGVPVEKKLKIVENILQKDANSFSEDTLTNSLKFSVDQTAIGRKGRFSMFQPNTLEDVFTFIHQSLINIISSTSKQVYPKIQLPEFVEIIRSQLQNFSYFLLPIKSTVKTDFFGYQFADNEITLMYNLALRTHSSILKLSYNKPASMAILEFFFYGDNEEGRWQRMGDLIDIVSDLTGVELIKNMSSQKGHNIQFKLNPKTNFSAIKKLFDILKICLDLTFDTDNPSSKRGLSGSKFLLKLSEIFRNKKEIYRSIIKLSINGPRINWLLSAALSNKAFYGGILEKKNLEILLNKLLSEENLYTKKSKLFIFRILNDPRSMTKLMKEEFGSKYYLVNTSNYKDLLEEKHIKQVDKYFTETLLDKLKSLIS